MRDVHYFTGLKPMMIFRVPWPMPPWRYILKAATPVMRSHGFRGKDFQPSGLFPYPDAKSADEWTEDDRRFAERLDRAFAGDEESLRKVTPHFFLYNWRRGRFELVREALRPI